MSKHCSVCALRKKSADDVEEERWLEEHKMFCGRNHTGTSGGMEAAGMKLIFHRSQALYGVRYGKYLGDGDSSSFKSVLESEPSGPDCKTEKLECVGRIQKRMGGLLLKIKREFKVKKLEDGKPFGGQHRLTDKEIHSLQIYYGKAIRDNVGDYRAMQRAVWAIYFHKISTDERPSHELCSITWCKYKKAQEDGKSFTQAQSS